jgi:hypothetical protein
MRGQRRQYARGHRGKQLHRVPFKWGAFWVKQLLQVRDVLLQAANDLHNEGAEQESACFLIRAGQRVSLALHAYVLSQ